MRGNAQSNPRSVVELFALNSKMQYIYIYIKLYLAQGICDIYEINFEY